MRDDEQPKAVRVDSWGFETDALRGRRVSMFGIFLVVFGALLFAGQLFTAAQLGASALFLALGIVLVLIGLRDRSDGALYFGIFVSALALSDLLKAAQLIHGDGWGTLFLGIGVLGTVFVRASASRGWGWPAIVGAVLTFWGASEVSTSYLGLHLDRLVGPALLVLLGAWLVDRNRR